MKNKKFGFTLAEVLITLAIIGVVAALTIPTLLSNYEERQRITQLKKIYSTLSQSYQTAQVEYGAPAQWTTKKTAEQMDLFLDKLTSKMIVTDKCSATSTICFDGDNYSYISLSGVDRGLNLFTGQPHVMLPDGAIIRFFLNSPICEYATSGIGTEIFSTNICGGISVDTNGKKGPNIFGKDTFLFFATKEGIVPAGKNGDVSEFNFEENCNRKSTLRGGKQAGSGCTAWVIENDNMDYLKCDDLSWDGKHSCSD